MGEEEVRMKEGMKEMGEEEVRMKEGLEEMEREGEEGVEIGMKEGVKVVQVSEMVQVGDKEEKEMRMEGEEMVLRVGSDEGMEEVGERVQQLEQRWLVLVKVSRCWSVLQRRSEDETQVVQGEEVGEVGQLQLGCHQPLVCPFLRKKWRKVKWCLKQQ